MRLENKRILITGASSGIGLELIKRLNNISGVKIVGVSRNISVLEGREFGRVFPISADIADPENIELILNKAIKKMGGIDIVIACAGFGYYEKFEKKDYGHIRRIFETNVFSPLFTLQRFLAKTKGKVSFIVISSALGKFGLPGYALYCSTKYALDGFHDSFQFETHKRLHYMTVYPLGVMTNFWGRMSLNMPLPKPLQTVDTVADAIIDGIIQEKKRVYTSKPFQILWAINRALPVLILFYQKIHKIKFNRWLRKRRRNTIAE